MPWNHRVRKRLYENVHGETEELYDIVECHYETKKQAENHESNSYTKDSITPQGETLDYLRWELEHMLTALDCPVIEEKEIVQYPFRKKTKEN